MVFLAYQGTLLGYRARPNGMDPDSCVFESWTMEQAPTAMLGEPSSITPEFSENWQDLNWGTVFSQDFYNMPRVTAGMHSPTYAGHNLSGVAELGVYHPHVAADRYLWD
jgi:hypothetical protein